MADVFISYSKKDRALAERVDIALQAAGYTTWWDHSLTPYASWPREIEEQVHAARAVFVIWTPNSVGSDWVGREACVGRATGKLVPGLFAPCDIPLEFNDVQYADLADWTGPADHPGWADALKWIGMAVRGEFAAAAPPRIAARGTPKTAEFVVPSKFTGPQLPPPRSGEVWKLLSLPREVNDFWLRTPGGDTTMRSYAVWNVVQLAICNFREVGFLDFDPVYFTPTKTYKHLSGNYMFQNALDSRNFFFLNTKSIGSLDRTGYKSDFDRGSRSGVRFNPIQGLISISPNRFLVHLYEAADGHWIDAINLNSSQPISSVKYGGLNVWLGRLKWSASSHYAIYSEWELPEARVHLFTFDFAQDGMRVACIKLNDRKKRDWDHAAWHPQLEIFAMSSWDADTAPHCNLEIFDPTNHQTIAKKHLGHSDTVRSIGWSCDGRFIATASTDNTISFWDCLKDETRVLFGHSGEVTRLEFSPDGQRLASFGVKRINEAIIWNHKTGDRVAQWHGYAKETDDSLKESVWSSDARMIATVNNGALEISRLVV